MAPDPLLSSSVKQAKGYYLTIDPECPTLGEPSDYLKVSELERRQRYVYSLRRRDITPRTARFASQYGYAIAELLERIKDESCSESTRDSWANLVYQHDVLLQRNSEVFHIPSEALQQLRDSLQRSLRNSLLAKYRDYMAMLLSDLKSTVRTFHPEHAEALTDYWINIQKQIKQEQKPNAKEQPIHAAIRAACSTLGIHEDRALGCIEFYAESNQQFHSNIEDRLAAGDSAGVAETLYNDLIDINNVFSTSGVRENDETKQALRYIVEWKIQALFTWTEKFQDMPTAWDLTPIGHEIKQRKTDEEKLPAHFLRDRTEERLYSEGQRTLAENATRQVAQGERTIASLGPDEVKAIQDNNPHWQEARKHLQTSKILEQKAKESWEKCVELVISLFNLEKDAHASGATAPAPTSTDEADGKETPGSHLG